jgi:DNA-binding response OmpR family regulator
VIPRSIATNGQTTAPDGLPGAVEIMVVDDHPSNVLLLQEMLRRKGYGVTTFLGGRDALASARIVPPDLILLDINMPDLNGYETCKLFQQDPTLASIPVIFLSALDQTADKMKAFRSGGVDYISKPFEFEEVHARVETHLKLSCLQKRLRDQNLHLELAQAHRQLSQLDQAKSEFLHMISHELRTPLNGLLGAADLILSEIECIPDAAELAEMLVESRQRILSLVDSALLLTQIEVEGGRFQAGEVNLREVLTAAAERAAKLAAARRVRVEAPQEPVEWTTGNRELLVRAWQALLETAVRFSGAGDSVTVRSENLQDAIGIVIDTSTGTIPGSALPHFFHLFGLDESSTAAGHLGLEPAMAKRILCLWGSSVEVENREPAGIRISVRCPRADRARSLTAAGSP